MRTRPALILAAIALALGAFVLLFEKDVASTDEREERKARLFPTLELDEVEGVALERAAGKLVLEKADGAWRVTEPLADLADEERVEQLVRSLVEIEARAERDAAEIEGGDAATGLGEGAYRATLTLEGGEERTIELGAREVPGALRFARLPGQDTLALVDTAIGDELAIDADALRERTLIDASTLDVRRASLRFEGQAPLAFARREGERWWLEAPLEDEADAAEVQRVLSELIALRAERFVADDELAQPVLSVVLTGESGATLESVDIGPELPGGNGRRLARLAERGVTVEIYGATLFKELPTAPESWRSRAALDFASYEVVELGLERAGKSVRVSRMEAGEDAGPRWVVTPGTEEFALDVGAVDDLLARLSSVRALSITDGVSAADAGLESPAARITLVFREGAPKPETVLEIGGTAGGGGIYARREGRDAILVVDETLAGRIDPASITILNAE